MAKTDFEAKFWIDSNLELTENLTDDLWKIFLKIAEYWPSEDVNVSQMKSRFRIFISNRIMADSKYLFEYINALKLVRPNEQQTDPYRNLFFNPAANVFPPNTPVARARQYVSNEFIKLYLSLGGFKAFDKSLKNYPGFIAGTNTEASTPYIPFIDEG